MRGRKPKPVNLKKIEGNPGKRKLNDREPKPEGIPTCPRELDKQGKREWRRISRELIRMGLLTSVDRAALTGYCSSWSRWIAAEADIQKSGLVIVNPRTGQPVRNPSVTIAERALDQMRKFAVEFGCSPSSRSRLSVGGKAQTEDPFESFMREMVSLDENLEVMNDPAPEKQSGPIHQ